MNRLLPTLAALAGIGFTGATLYVVEKGKPLATPAP